MPPICKRLSIHTGSFRRRFFTVKAMVKSHAITIEKGFVCSLPIDGIPIRISYFRIRIDALRWRIALSIVHGRRQGLGLDSLSCKIIKEIIFIAYGQVTWKVIAHARVQPQAANTMSAVAIFFIIWICSFKRKSDSPLIIAEISCERNKIYLPLYVPLSLIWNLILLGMYLIYTKTGSYLKAMYHF